ncbi:hypothetical protein [Paraburkholderia caledonica]|uniref:hypothetical protein n=1 Tax=Paraburkholderia caledonica TaxID=134536 RepID=UPI0013DEDFEA|nr:hypothetical protein [Paraburkholderia caledonica]
MKNSVKMPFFKKTRVLESAPLDEQEITLELIIYSVNLSKQKCKKSTVMNWPNQLLPAAAARAAPQRRRRRR